MFINIDAWTKRQKSMIITTKITMQITHCDKTNSVHLHKKQKIHILWSMNLQYYRITASKITFNCLIYLSTTNMMGSYFLHDYFSDIKLYHKAYKIYMLNYIWIQIFSLLSLPLFFLYSCKNKTHTHISTVGDGKVNKIQFMQI